MKEKICRKCGELKNIDEYYVHLEMTDQHLNICKECTKKRIRTLSHTEHGRKYDHNRNQTPKRKKWLIEYQRKVRIKHKLEYKCRTITNNALRDGRIERPNHCGACLKDCVPQAHHEDYRKPFEIKWICEECHRAISLQYKRVDS